MISSVLARKPDVAPAVRGSEVSRPRVSSPAPLSRDVAGGEPKLPKSAADESASAASRRAQGPALPVKAVDQLPQTPAVQKKEQPGAKASAPADAASLANKLGPGTPIDATAASRFSRAYGHDLGGVRVHPNSPVPASIGARAFTVGRDVAFAPGEYKPGTRDGDRLIGHELAHVVQQSGGAGEVQAAGLGHDGFEAEADRAADTALSGGVVSGITPLRGKSVQRAPGNPAPPAPPPPKGPGAPGSGAKPAVGAGIAPGEVDLSSGEFAPADETAAALGKGGEVQVRLPGLAEGKIKVQKGAKGWFTPRPYAIALHHPALAQVTDLETVLVVRVKDNVVDGGVTIGKVGPASVPVGAGTLLNTLGKSADALGWLGLTSFKFPQATNTFSGGALDVSVDGVSFSVGGFLEGSGSFKLDNQTLTLEGSSKVSVAGAAEGTLNIKKDVKTGQLGGDVSIGVTLAGFGGNVAAKLENGFVSIQGTVGYTGNKLSGSVTLIATDAETAKNVTKMEPVAGQLPDLGPDAAKNNKPGKRAFCGWGELTFTITEWLAGKVQVIVNSKGQVTVKGEIAPPAQIVLFEQKEWIKSLFKLEVRASYGIPVVGNVFVFANIGLDAMAKIGPGVLKDIKLQGQYSTDPDVEKSLSLQGTLNISAFAGLRLRAEGGVGITILGHDIKAGVGVWALAGVRGYVEATPIIGYRDKGGKGEFYIKGSMEIAGQLFLGLGGDLFIEVDSPWWSPLPDKKWTWPLGQIEYPIGEFGIGASVDYVFGSKTWPEINFSDAKFDSDKFMTDLLNDNASKGGGKKEENKKGKWGEGNAGAPTAPGPQQKGKGEKGKPDPKAPKGKGADGKGGKGKDKGKLDKDVEGDELWNEPIGEKVPFSDEGESHSLYIETSGEDATVMVASKPMSLAQRLAVFEKTKLDDPADQKLAKSLIGQARKELTKADQQADKLARAKKPKGKGGKGAKGKGPKPKPKKNDLKAVNKALKQIERRLANIMSQLFKLFNVPEPNKVLAKYQSQLALADKHAQKKLTKAIKDKPKRYGPAKSWAQVRTKLETDPALEAMMKRPLAVEHDFGAQAHAQQAVPAVTRALKDVTGKGDKALADSTASGYKGLLHAGKAPFNSSRAQLVQQIFAGSRKGAVTEVLHSEYRAKLEMGDDEGHTKFEPKSLTLVKTLPDKSTVWSYRTFGSSNFVATVDKHGFVQTVEGFNLTLKDVNAGHPSGKGKTHRSPGFIKNSGMHASHVIADQFKGSGYKKAHNLVSASATFNLTRMSREEAKIVTHIVNSKAKKFDMTVTISWGDFNEKVIVTEMMKAYPSKFKSRPKLEKKLAAMLKKGFPKRVLNVEYAVSINGGKAKYFNTGPDLWLGTNQK